MIAFIFIVNALVILGIYNAFSPGQAFGFIRKFILHNAGNAEIAIEITKPIYGCFVCMPSLWGTAAYLLYSPYPWYYFPIYVFALSGFMFLIKLYFYE